MLDAELIKKVRPFTLLSPGKLKSLKRLATLVNAKGIEGDFVECGTYKGGSAAMVATELTPGRHLWLYDSFQGMPPVREIDGVGAREAVGMCRADQEDVIEALSVVGLPQTQYTIRKGMFDQTFKEPLPKRVALLHCDADWYDSVTIVLETFYPLVEPGGVVVLDDFGWWEGTREAFYDFCIKHGEKPLLERLEMDQAYWIKGKAHNRD
jgi:O-methyltransferase